MRLYILAYRTMLQHITNMLNGIPQTMLAIMFLSRTEAINAISMVKNSIPLINAFIVCPFWFVLPNVLDEPHGCLARSLRSRIRDKHPCWL